MPLHILVVDDIPASRQALCALVCDLGHQAVAVDSGQAALAQVQRHRPDLVLLDLLMPSLDGFEVSRRLREQCQDRWLPVIVTSSLQGDEHFIRALHSGADDYLARPVNAALLDAKLRHYARVLALQAHLTGLAQRQRDIQDNILDAVVTLDATGRIEALNRAALQRFAPQVVAPQVQALQVPAPQVVAPPVQSPHGQACEDLLGVGLHTLLTQRECRLRQADGSHFEAEISLSLWHEEALPAALALAPNPAATGPAAQPAPAAPAVRYTLVLRDLTERRQIERMKDEFLATVSHELRTPLTSVLGALGLLAGGAAGPLPPAAVPLADIARRNGERLSRLIDDILDLTKLEGDRLILHLRPQPVVPLLREAMAANQAYAASTGVQLQAQGLDDAAGVALPLDADRFLQVMANLLSNAIKHSPPGQAVTINLALADGGTACITVRDHGPGIAEGFRGQMFEKFSQAEGGDRRAQGGTGLGLYISRMLVERMGGRISADVPGQGGGAAFSLRFPTGAHRP